MIGVQGGTWRLWIAALSRLLFPIAGHARVHDSVLNYEEQNPQINALHCNKGFTQLHSSLFISPNLSISPFCPKRWIGTKRMTWLITTLAKIEC
ncbi:hypothetical protein GGR51DRAFT_539407 [Nemania sp. FL0031]|nr:hypothetical protein GGR51DRAFT_539407 [Nemania sp. FL0031]